MAASLDIRRAIRSSIFVTCGCFALSAPGLGQTSRALSGEEQQELRQGLQTLEQSLRPLNERGVAGAADAGVFHKGLAWALRYDTEFTPADVALLRKAVVRGQERAKSLAAGNQPWAKRRGKLVLGYVSRVDGSVQPYGLIVPQGYDPVRPTRLDIVLHG